MRRHGAGRSGDPRKRNPAPTLGDLMDTMAEVTGGQRLGGQHEMTGWLRGRLAAITAATTGDGIPPCIHLAGTSEPGHVALWSPGRMLCRACAVTEIGDHVIAGCDRCGSSDGLRAVTCVVGMVVVHGVVCSSCAALEAGGGSS